MFAIFMRLELGAFFLLTVKGLEIAVFVNTYVDDGMRVSTLELGMDYLYGIVFLTNKF